MFNPKDMEKAMRQLGIKNELLEATEVVIKTKDKDLVITNPNVTKISMHGQISYQITGAVTEKPKEKFSDEDVNVVAEQTGASQAEAKAALEEAGDIAAAIMKLNTRD